MYGASLKVTIQLQFPLKITEIRYQLASYFQIRTFIFNDSKKIGSNNGETNKLKKIDVLILYIV
jgi:hypothetical protein